MLEKELRENNRLAKKESKKKKYEEQDAELKKLQRELTGYREGDKSKIPCEFRNRCWKLRDGCCKYDHSRDPGGYAYYQ